MEVMLLKSPSGSLVPMGDDESEKLKRIKPGVVVKCDISVMRNGPFFRKWFTLVTVAFNQSSERMTPRKYKGREVLLSFDVFRKEVTILAGYFDVVYRYDGTFKMEAQSLKWGSMTEETFTALYSATIDAILQKILIGTNKDELEYIVEQVLSYA